MRAVCRCCCCSSATEHTWWGYRRLKNGMALPTQDTISKLKADGAAAAKVSKRPNEYKTNIDWAISVANHATGGASVLEEM